MTSSYRNWLMFPTLISKTINIYLNFIPRVPTIVYFIVIFNQSLFQITIYFDISLLNTSNNNFIHLNRVSSAKAEQRKKKTFNNYFQMYSV